MQGLDRPCSPGAFSAPMVVEDWLQSRCCCCFCLLRSCLLLLLPFVTAHPFGFLQQRDGFGARTGFVRELQQRLTAVTHFQARIQAVANQQSEDGGRLRGKGRKERKYKIQSAAAREAASLVRLTPRNLHVSIPDLCRCPTQREHSHRCGGYVGVVGRGTCLEQRLHNCQRRILAFDGRVQRRTARGIGV